MNTTHTSRAKLGSRDRIFLATALTISLGLSAGCAHNARNLRAPNTPAPELTPRQSDEISLRNQREGRRQVYEGSSIYDGAVEVGIGLGIRQQEEEWGEAEELFNFFALDLSAKPRGWPLELTARLSLAGDDERPDFSSAEVERVDVREVDFGLQIPLEFRGGTRLKLGGGLAWVEVTVSEDDDFYDWDWDSDEVDEDSDLGWWAGAGLALPLGGGHSVGLDARWTEVDVILEGLEVPAGGWTFLVSWVYRHRIR